MFLAPWSLQVDHYDDATRLLWVADCTALPYHEATIDRVWALDEDAQELVTLTPPAAVERILKRFAEQQALYLIERDNRRAREASWQE